MIADSMSAAPRPDTRVSPSPSAKYETSTATTTSVSRIIVDVTEEMCLSPSTQR